MIKIITYVINDALGQMSSKIIYRTEDYIKSVTHAKGTFVNSDIDNEWHGYEVEVIVDLGEYQNREEAIKDSKSVIFYYRHVHDIAMTDFIRGEFKYWDSGYRGENLTELMRKEDNLFLLDSVRRKDSKTWSMLESIAMYLDTIYEKDHYS